MTRLLHGDGRKRVQADGDKWVGWECEVRRAVTIAVERQIGGGTRHHARRGTDVAWEKVVTGAVI